MLSWRVIPEIMVCIVYRGARIGFVSFKREREGEREGDKEKREKRKGYGVECGQWLIADNKIGNR